MTKVKKGRKVTKREVDIALGLALRTITEKDKKREKKIDKALKKLGLDKELALRILAAELAVSGGSPSKRALKKYVRKILECPPGEEKNLSAEADLGIDIFSSILYRPSWMM